MKKKIATTMLAFALMFLCMPQSALAADDIVISYSGGQLLDNVATVSATKVNKLTELTKSPTSTEYVGAWADWSYPETGQTGKSLTLPQGTKTWSNTYFIMRNALAVNGENYDIKGTVIKSVNQRSGSVLLGKRSALRNLDVRTDGTGTDTTPGVFVSITYTILKAGTDTPLNLSELWFGCTDLDLLQSFGSSDMNLTGQNMMIKQKGDFSLDGTGNAYINDTGIYQSAYINLPERGNFYVNVSNQNQYNAVYGFKQSAGSSINFYTTKHTVTYTSVNGTVSKGSEAVIAGLNPAGSTNTPNSGHYFVQWKTNQDVTLSDGTKILSGSVITEDQIKSVVVDRDMSFTAYNDPYLKVTYEWVGDHPNKPVPGGKTDITKGSFYDVDTTYKPGDTVRETNVTYKGTTYPRGTWTFVGWDKTGSLTINEDTVIKGTWTFVPEWNIDTEAVNGTITEPETNIPNGENRVITYTPSEGYQLKSLTVDGEPKDIKEYPASYTFEGIDADHEVKAVFERIPALSIEKTSDKDVYNAGDTVTYTVTVRQIVDGAEARNVTVTDTMPDGVLLNKDSIQGNVQVKSAEDHAYELGIPALGEVTYTYTAVTTKALDAEALVNVVSASAENVPGDPVKAEAKVKSLVPKPMIEKIVSNETPVSGEKITYSISVKEPQDGIVLRNAVVTDPIPEGIEADPESIVIEGNPGRVKSFENNMLVIEIPELSTETVIKFTAKVTAVKGEVDNIATLAGDDVEEIRDNAVITVKEPNPTLTKSVDKSEVLTGGKVKYTITVQSAVMLINASLTDVVPDGVDVDADSITCTPEARVFINGKEIRIVAQEVNSLTVTYTAKVNGKGNQDNKVTLTADNFPEGPLSAIARTTASDPKKVAPNTPDQPEADDPDDDPDDEDDPDDPDTPDGKKSPKTGQGLPFVLVLVGLAVILSAGYLIVNRRKKTE